VVAGGSYCKPGHASVANRLTPAADRSSAHRACRYRTVKARALLRYVNRSPSSYSFIFIFILKFTQHLRRCLRSASSPSLIIRRNRRSTVGDRAFPVAASRVWNDLPQHVTAAESLPVFCSHLKTHLFRRCFP